jgi:hypothetical protein
MIYGRVTRPALRGVTIVRLSLTRAGPVSRGRLTSLLKAGPLRGLAWHGQLAEPELGTERGCSYG